MSFSAGYVGTAVKGEQRNLRQLFFFFLLLKDGIPQSIIGAPGWCDEMVTWSTVLLHLPAASALAAQLSLCTVSAAALPTVSAHPQHVDRQAQVVGEQRQFGSCCFGWDMFALANSATKATAESRGALWYWLKSAGSQNEPWLEPLACTS